MKNVWEKQREENSNKNHNKIKDFVIKNIKYIFENFEETYNDCKQSKICLLISHKNILQQKIEKY